MVDPATGEAPAGERRAPGGWGNAPGYVAPVDATLLPDTAVLSCRLGREWLALVGAIALLVTILVLLFIFDLHPAQLGIAGFTTAWLLDTALKLFVLPRQVGGAIEITATEFADLYPVVEELRERFDLPTVRVFVSCEDDLMTGAYGLWPPYSVRFSTFLINGLNVEEFRFALGREMGAIRLGHPHLALVFGGQAPVFTNALQWILLPRQLIFAWWYRSQELSRDRIGLLACRSVRVALTALVKMEARPMVARVSMDAVEPQVLEVARGRLRWGEFISTIGVQRPLLMRRIRCLVEWAGAPEPAPAAPADLGAR
jgi:Zn-dependent protease with chaperone function